MELYNGNFYKVLLKLTESPYPEVQYNCAGVIGHLAINGECEIKSVPLASLIFVLRFLPFGDVSLNIRLLNIGCGDSAVVMCLLHSIWCA